MSDSEYGKTPETKSDRLNDLASRASQLIAETMISGEWSSTTREILNQKLRQVWEIYQSAPDQQSAGIITNIFGISPEELAKMLQANPDLDITQNFE